MYKKESHQPTNPLEKREKRYPEMMGRNSWGYESPVRSSVNNLLPKEKEEAEEAEEAEEDK